MKIKLINKGNKTSNNEANKAKTVYDVTKYVNNDDKPILKNGFNKTILDRIYNLSDKNTKNNLNHSIPYLYRKNPCARYILLNKYTYDLKIEKLIVNDYIWNFIDYFEVKFINQIKEIKITKKIPISDEIAKFQSLKTL
ncbi:hypothetical protein PIROE2DRAFT_16525 [Piromyces sp. E2]|nr:hypothetical protein PIROE2DRAFT_16525 [Piromyces sp. E2]|eukprot:OUM58255.1 hypothetical protein PIROE2DRAFT_16525 [Piromyces sp. E2]